MYSPVSIRNGTKLPMPKPGKVIGSSRFRDVVRALNGLLNVKVLMVDSSKAQAVISESGTILELPKSVTTQSTPTGGGATRFRVKSVSGDYLVCHTWDGATEGTEDINVAKPVEIRHSSGMPTVSLPPITAGVGTTVALTYTYSQPDSNILDGQRTVAATGYPTQTEVVIPPYYNDTSGLAEIWADQPSGGTGVSAANVWMDTNRAQREWTQIA